jgi:hypothetical protein
MAHHDFLGSDGAFHLAEEGKVHEVPACYDKAVISNPHNDVIPGNNAIVLISPGRFGESLTCSREMIAINPCDPVTLARIGIRQYFR